MNEYTVTPIRDQYYDLKGIRRNDNGQTFCYWTKKGVSLNNVNEIIIIFNNNNVVNVTNNQICISLNGINNSLDIEKALKIFADNVNKLGVNTNNIKFIFVVSDQKTNTIANSLIQKYRLNGEIKNLTKNKENNINENKTPAENQQKIEEQKKVEQELEAAGTIENITTNQNGISKNYTIVNGNKILDNNGTLSISELKAAKLKELQNDPLESLKIQAMTEQELDEYLTSLVTINKKENYLEHANTSSKNTISAEEAYRRDGKYNEELGIIYGGNRESKVAAEENGQIVELETNKDRINSNGTTTENYGFNNVISFPSNNNVELHEEGVQEREVNKIYYIDNDNNIYDDNSQIIGRLGENGYIVDENNNLNQNGQLVGQIGDINSMGKSTIERQETKVFKKVLKPDDTNYPTPSNENAAFANLPIIMFIISLLLLIGSGIILLLMK